MFTRAAAGARNTARQARRRPRLPARPLAEPRARASRRRSASCPSPRSRRRSRPRARARSARCSRTRATRRARRPNSGRLERALGQLDFMVSIDIYLNETTRHADVILPGSSPLERSHYDIGLYQLAVRNVANYSRAGLRRARRTAARLGDPAAARGNLRRPGPAGRPRRARRLRRGGGSRRGGKGRRRPARRARRRKRCWPRSSRAAAPSACSTCCCGPAPTATGSRRTAACRSQARAEPARSRPGTARAPHPRRPAHRLGHGSSSRPPEIAGDVAAAARQPRAARTARSC